MLRGFIGGFSSRYDLREVLVVYEIDSPIRRIDFIVSRPPPQAERNNRCNARVVPGPVPFSLFRFPRIQRPLVPLPLVYVPSFSLSLSRLSARSSRSSDGFERTYRE